MKKLKDFITEKMSDREYFLNDYSFFISIINNVELKEDQLLGMFRNIPEKSLKYWAEEIEDRTAGTDTEITAKELMTGDVAGNFAEYFFKHPIED